MPDDAAAEIQDPRGRAVFGGPADGPGSRPGGYRDPATDDRFFGHPAGLATLFSAELWERFSFYGLRPLLVLFMAAAVTDSGVPGPGFGFNRDDASAIVGIYGAFVYLMSLPGGWVADRLLGLRAAVFWGAVLITAGHLSIGLSGLANTRVPFFLGLVLIVLGTGLLKPNISAIVGDLYPEGGARRDAGYSLYYMGINIGAFFGQILTGSLAFAFGWHWGFGLAGIGMLVGLLVFWFYQRTTLGTAGLREARLPPAEQAAADRRNWLVLGVGLALVAAVFALAASGALPLDAGTVGGAMTYVLVGLAALFFGYMFVATTGQERKQVLVILVLFIFAAVFWSAFEQAPTSLNLFANDFTERVYDTSWLPASFGTVGRVLGLALVIGVVGWFVAHVARRGTTAGFPILAALGALAAGALVAFAGFVAGDPTFEVPTTWFQSINALCIVLFAPVFAALWIRLSQRGGDLSAPAKFALGLALAGVGFALMIPAANLIAGAGDGSGIRVSPWWLVFSYLFQSLGELCLSPVGLSSMTKLSPRRFVGQMLGVWFLAASVGHLIGGLVGGNVDPENVAQMPPLFLWTAVGLFVSAAVLGALVVPIRRMMASAPTTATAGH